VPSIGQFGAETLSSVAQGFAALPYRTLVPLRAFFEDKAWRKGWTGLFGLAAVVPFFLLHLTINQSSIGALAWGFALYFAVIWLIAVYMLVRPEPVPWTILAPLSLFTIVAWVAIAVGLERHLGANGHGWVHNILTIGIPE
jgi:hypothetical protein